MTAAQQGGPEVAVVVPSSGDVSMRWAVRLATLRMPAHHIVTRSTAAIDLAREQAVRDALDADPEWLLLLDSDVIPPESVFRRLQAHGKSVVSALYHVDGEFVHPAAWMLDEDDRPTTVTVDEDGQMAYEDGDDVATLEPDDGGLLTVDAIGLGCVLVHSSVFARIERPWFRWTKGYEHHPWDLRDDTGVPGISEDFFFCHRLARADIDVHLDTSVRCAHEKGCLLTHEGVVLESQVSDG